ncbi:hypothetical protein GGI25_005621 [Coemansia spiralis]|uniref:Endonuclease V n=2 Tax=Coemansia TaxID=4863 RepID=A0A9W8KVK2_9FUNG|nr:endonuclease V-domain-containing protein [Coemansia spiralis]KAJ1994622.1 hypothetical protein EDC05_001539 [Coemansia umbellata]KAJ2624427.1 hypothetical protein GGI26_001562 [Coemansia sp. RSA 1358]KAJ2671099.1 hypothetical protein GGI25_005621 [Coemansia spiralis]
MVGHEDNNDTKELAQKWALEQAELRKRRVEADRLDFATDEGFVGLERVGGVDISYPRYSSSDGDRAVAALTVLAYPSLSVLYEVCEEVPIDVPYIAGFLAFREMAAYRQVFGRLQRERPQLMPQVVLVDGNGTLHPRRFGSACQLGVELDVPTIGVAKNYLHIDDLAGIDARGLKRAFCAQNVCAQELVGTSGTSYGMAVAPGGGTATNPIFVSSGHCVSLRTAVKLVRACSLHRVPEPIRVADLQSRALVRRMEQQ